MATSITFPDQSELCLKTACCCQSMAFWLKFPDCISCANEMTCCCLSGSMSCGLTSPTTCYSSSGETSCFPVSLLNCEGPVCMTKGSGNMCCIMQSTSAYQCDLKCKACVMCKSQSLCIDNRAAIPCNNEVPFEIGLCGIMCVKSGKVGVVVEANTPTSAPGVQKMGR